MLILAGVTNMLRESEILGANNEWLPIENVPGIVPDEWCWALFSFSTLNFNDKVYVFGGACDIWVLPNCYVYDGDWSEIQVLLGARGSHRSISKDGVIYHIGGDDNHGSSHGIETWRLRDGPILEFTRTRLTTVLDGYYRYPESFFVSDYLQCT